VATEPEPVDDDSSRMLSDFVYESVRAAIIDGRYNAGERLRERDIALELNVSRVPIRTALPRLETAGFARILPRRTAVVSHITTRDVEELYDLRSVLEPLIARSAARRVAAGIAPDGLREAFDAASAALAADDFAALNSHNARLHREIAMLADNQLLNRTLEPLTERSDRLNAVTIESDPVTRHAEHTALVTAVSEGHAELAEASAYVHVELGRQRTLAALPTHPHYSDA
jgi:DNA-binding GntR family transcriptional regulator